MANRSRAIHAAIITLATIAVLLPPLAARTHAQTTSIDAIANDTSPDRQSRLESGARKEGKLLIYTTGTQIQPLIDRFGAKYPFVKATLYRADSNVIVQKVVEEYRAAYYECDGFELSGNSLIVARQAGVLSPFTSPEMASFSAEAIDPQRYWVSVRESYTGIGYNTKLVPPDQAPKTWTDLLRPEYKGKLGMPGNQSTVAEWTGLLLSNYGEDFMAKLAQQDLRVYKISARAVTSLLSSGEIAIQVRTSNAHVREDQKKGLPVVWVAPGPVDVNDVSVALAAKAPHPHAMMLMIDFLLSEEGQKLYKELGYSSARKGLEDADTPRQKVYLASRPRYMEEMEEWTTLFNKLFASRK
jgi:iron(III) transport system substrate-binding protein